MSLPNHKNNKDNAMNDPQQQQQQQQHQVGEAMVVDEHQQQQQQQQPQHHQQPAQINHHPRRGKHLLLPPIIPPPAATAATGREEEEEESTPSSAMPANKKMAIDNNTATADTATSDTNTATAANRLQHPVIDKITTLMLKRHHPGGEGSIDYLSQLPDDLTCRILCHLNAESLVKMREINTKYNRLASSDQVWEELCQRLWRNKVHCRYKANNTNDNDQSSHLSRLRAYQLSIEDARDRQFITRDEMCFDSPSVSAGSGGNNNHNCDRNNTGTVWSFRFKESAGQDWTSVDPWYSGMQARKFVFLVNGTIKQYIEIDTNEQHQQQSRTDEAAAAAAAAEIGAGAGGDDTEMEHVQHDDDTAALQQQQQQQDNNNNNNNINRAIHLMVPPTFSQEQADRHLAEAKEAAAAATSGEGNPSSSSDPKKATATKKYYLIDPPITMTWRFLTRPMDLPTRPIGSYVRLTAGGRDVPTYSVRRSPTNNWGFIMESCWGLYASFELPLRRNNSNADNTNAETTTGATNNNNDHSAAAAAAAAAVAARQRGGGGGGRRRLLRRTEEGDALWVAEEEEEDNDDDGEAAERRRNNNTDASQDINILSVDSALQITNEVQWREAFLYNVGARVLPEGDEATDEFDRAWGGLG